MHLSRVSTRLFFTCALLFALGLQSAAGADTKPGVVIQVSDDSLAAWNFTLRNVKNMKSQLGKVKIEVVAFGPGIYMLKRDSGVGDQLDAEMLQGVTFVACEDSMHARKLTRKDMHPDLVFVPSGVAEIVAKQLQNWSYLKP